MRWAPALVKRCSSREGRKQVFPSIRPRFRWTPASSESWTRGTRKDRRGMLLARVVGNVVSTQKHVTFHGATLLLVQPLTVNDEPRGPVLLAVDGVGAGVTDKVLVVLEG